MVPFVNIHTHKPENGDIILLNAFPDALQSSDKYYSYGIHPWDIDNIDVESQIEIIDKISSENKILALGETGLDRAIKSSMDKQKEIFIKQLDIANKYNLPVIIHCVRTWNDILSIRKNGKYQNPWIFHGYNGNLQTANQIIKAKCYLSFGKLLIINNKLQDVFLKLPIDHIFLETDDSNLKIEEVYDKAAELYDICIDDLKLSIFKNFTTLLGNNNF